MISIIIIVKNDYGIDKTLDAITKITKPTDYEVIVVDASNGLLDNIKDKYPFVRWINYSADKTNKITIPEQRNVGIHNAKGEIIVFLDASCIPIKNWLSELYNSYKLYGDKFICGLILPTKKNTVNNISLGTTAPEYMHEAPTGNLLIEKSVFANIGYFDESLSYGEDIDLTWRAMQAGYKIRNNKDAVVYHDWGNFNTEIKRAYKYGKARAVLYKKHLKWWRNYTYYDKVALVYAIYDLMMPIGIIFPAYFLLLAIPILGKSRRNNLIVPVKTVFLNVINGFGILKGLIFNF